MKTVLKRALCGITAFVVAAGAMSYFPADTFPGIARGVTAYAENETWRITITADNLADISGDGSLEHPYEITTAEELLAVMEARRTVFRICGTLAPVAPPLPERPARRQPCVRFERR